MNKFFLAIRAVTAPHIFALMLLTLLFIAHPSYLGSVWFFVAGVFCLTVLPMLAYPLQRFIPGFKSRGREGQRTLAMIFSALGYVIGVVIAFAFGAPRELKMVFVEYLLCGISILISSKVFKKKASGHACGIVGPVAMLIYLGLYIPAAVCAVLTIPVYVSSIKTRRHTPSELILGSIIPVAMLAIVHLVFLVI